MADSSPQRPRHQNGDGGDQQRSNQQRNETEGGGFGSGRPLRAKQEGKRRNLAEEDDGFEQDREDDANGGENRHARTRNEDGQHEALEQIAGAHFSADAGVYYGRRGRAAQRRGNRHGDGLRSESDRRDKHQCNGPGKGAGTGIEAVIARQRMQRRTPCQA